MYALENMGGRPVTEAGMKLVDSCTLPQGTHDFCHPEGHFDLMLPGANARKAIVSVWMRVWPSIPHDMHEWHASWLLLLQLLHCMNHGWLVG